MLNSVRKKSILYILEKYEQEPEHAHQVKKLALILFDKTKGLLHNFSDEQRCLLEAGALLHDIGYYMNASEHNKNSAKIIREERPSGFSDEEILIIACVARYHKGKKPKDKHEWYSALSETSKDVARKLSAFCKLADGLDCSHSSIVNDINCIYNSFSRDFYVILKINTPDCSYEILKANYKKDLLEEEFNLDISLKID